MNQIDKKEIRNARISISIPPSAKKSILNISKIESISNTETIIRAVKHYETELIKERAKNERMFE